MVPRIVEDEVVSLLAVCEVLLGVVDDVVCADRSDHVRVLPTAHAGHFRSERFGDLYGERSYATRGAIDQHLLPWLYLSFVAESLEGGECGDGYGRGLVKREVGRLQR